MKTRRAGMTHGPPPPPSSRTKRETCIYSQVWPRSFFVAGEHLPAVAVALAVLVHGRATAKVQQRCVLEYSVREKLGFGKRGKKSPERMAKTVQCRPTRCWECPLWESCVVLVLGDPLVDIYGTAARTAPRSWEKCTNLSLSLSLCYFRTSNSRTSIIFFFATMPAV